jgi:glycosyltransferase involved in cell wall biosynthesis
MIYVLIPTYNRQKFLPQAINSLLKQSYNDFKIVIYNDGSTDNTSKILKEYSLKYKDRFILLGESENHGVNYSRNRLIQYALGSVADYFVWQDSDDVSVYSRLKELEEAIKRQQADILFSAMYFFVDPNMNRKKLSTLDISKYKNRAGLFNNMNFPTAIFNKKTCGIPFDSSIRKPGGDLVWILDLIKSKRIKFGYYDKPLYYLRRHPDRLTAERFKDGK